MIVIRSLYSRISRLPSDDLADVSDRSLAPTTPNSFPPDLIMTLPLADWAFIIVLIQRMVKWRTSNSYQSQQWQMHPRSFLGRAESLPRALPHV